MPNFIFNQSHIQVITLPDDVYTDGHMTITFSPDANNMKSILGTKVANISDTTIESIRNGFATKDIIKVPQIIALVYKNQAINFQIESNREEFHQLIAFAEQLIKNKQVATSTMTLSQENIFNSIVEIYIEDIVECSDDYELVVKLLRCCFYEKFLQIEPEIKKISVLQNLSESVLDSVKALWKICHGSASLESTYTRVGQSLPLLNTQRFILHKLCMERLCNKFSNLSDKDRLCMIMGFTIYKRQHQQLHPFENIEKRIKQAWIETLESSETKAIFAYFDGRPGFRLYLHNILISMEILRIERIDYERINKLKDCFGNSPTLDKILTELNASLKRESELLHNKLYRSLKASDLKGVAQAVEQGADINEYLHCGRTPLLLSLSIETMKQGQDDIALYLIEQGADVKKFNAYHTGAPIMAAIVMVSLRIVNKLLEKGVNPSEPCCTLAYKSTELQTMPQLYLVSAPVLAISKFLSERTSPRGEIVKTLLNALGSENKILPEEIHILVTLAKRRSSYTNTQRSMFAAESEQDLIKFYQSILPLLFLHINDNIIPVITSLIDNNYGQALRRACTSSHSIAHDLIALLCKNKELLKLDINEAAGPQQLTAIHYCAKRGDTIGYRLLIEYGANPKIKDESGKSAEEYYAEQSVHNYPK